jgi:hypothetical protein
MDEKLKLQIPSQGWRQFLTGRKEMLDAFDKAREQSRAHEVETYHGRVAEAVCRKWLAGFLPSRYGVTSGYVVSSGLASSQKVPHFDVVIYDRLEAPVLWIEDNPDSSAQGRSLAIPVEHVCAILEVKSRFCRSTVRQAIEHLADLSPMMNGADESGERYPLHLPANFSCGCVFFELREADAADWGAMDAIIDGIALRGFWGGVILRAGGQSRPNTGRFGLTQSETPIERCPEGESPLLDFGLGATRELAEKLHIGSLLRWSESAFAEFGFDLIAMMRGSYQTGRLSSFYGVGSSELEALKAKMT